jgi:hypothetical protein
MKDRCGEFIFRNSIPNGQINQAKLVGKEKHSFAKKIRKKSYFNNLNALNL